MKFEEFVEGTAYESEERAVPVEEMVAFAERYDRQAIHVGTPSGATGPGRPDHVIASGYLGLAVAWQQWLDVGVFGDDAVAGVALDSARWVRPMEPGVRVRTRVRVGRTWVSSKGKGMVQLQLQLVDGAGDELLSFETIAIMARRGDG